ncbi:hypothetical protein FRB90_000471 [Tulasnella sp. 427]|nr:hypothetical protein FRB90_000471 [Tulasnella sp. 427]
MPSIRVFTGDENGLTKSIRLSVPEGRIRADTVISTSVVTVDERPGEGKVQRMATGLRPDGSKLLAVGRSTGHTTLHSYRQKTDEIELKQKWNETRFKAEDAFIGLSISSRGTYSCTSRGLLRLQPFDADSETSEEVPQAPSLTTNLPMRLKDWRLAPNETHFVYGGDEVEVSLRDTEKALTESVKTSEEAINPGKKRKERKDKIKLLHGEVWRAQNVPHDFLNIRQPVHNTALSFVHYGSTISDSHNIIAAGTAAGAVRLYDVRSQRKPTQNWEKVCPNSSVKDIQCGRLEHQIFVSDSQSRVYAIDPRNGKTAYRYPSAKGAVISLAPAPHDFLLSVSLDHFIRLYTTPPPPAKANQNQPEKGKLVHEEYLQGTPSIVVWDGVSGTGKDAGTKKKNWEQKNARDAEEEEEIWNNMEVTGVGRDEDNSSDDESEIISDEESEEESRPKQKRLKLS